MDTSNYRLPKTNRGLKTFNYIIKTGKALFAKNGFQATSINDIIDKSNVAAGTFYIYFDDKLALYLYLLDEYRVGIRKASKDATIGLTSRYEIEKAGLKAFIIYVWKDPLAYRIIWESLFIDFHIFKDYYKSFADAYIKQLRKYVSLGQVRDDLDLETMSYVLMGISNFVGLQVLFRDFLSNDDVDMIVNQVMEMLEKGIFLKR
jgi:AcrR family transcriptional regulator